MSLVNTSRLGVDLTTRLELTVGELDCEGRNGCEQVVLGRVEISDTAGKLRFGSQFRGPSGRSSAFIDVTGIAPGATEVIVESLDHGTFRFPAEISMVSDVKFRGWEWDQKDMGDTPANVLVGVKGVVVPEFYDARGESLWGWGPVLLDGVQQNHGFGVDIEFTGPGTHVVTTTAGGEWILHGVDGGAATRMELRETGEIDYLMDNDDIPALTQVEVHLFAEDDRPILGTLTSPPLQVFSSYPGVEVEHLHDTRRFRFDARNLVGNQADVIVHWLDIEKIVPLRVER